MLKNFENIPVELPVDEVLKRMGYNRHLTGISEEQANKITYYMQEGYKICLPAGRLERTGIVEHADGYVVLENGYRIESDSVCRLLAASRECVLLGARADLGILQAIEQFILEKNGVAALIYDAVASEVVDAALTWMIRRLGQEVSRLGLRPTRMRYSAGYGDFPLENQRIFYDVLKLDELGVTLSEKFIFSPEKTVTALLGLE